MLEADFGVNPVRASSAPWVIISQEAADLVVVWAGAPFLLIVDGVQEIQVADRIDSHLRVCKSPWICS